MNDFFLFALMVLTSFRATWLITRDDFPAVKRIRDWVVAQHLKRSQETSFYDMNGDLYQDFRGKWYWLAELLTCPWCVSVWMSGAIVGGTTILSPEGLSHPVLWFGAVAAGSALIAHYVDRDEE